MSEQQFIASLSYGKDSIAMLHVIRDVLSLPLDRIITADVWATETIPAEIPPMVEFKEYADAEIKKRWGIEVEHFCATASGHKNSCENQFYTQVGETRQKKRAAALKTARTCHNAAGDNSIYGFPLTRGAWCNSKLKVEALNEAKKTFENVFYHVRQSGKNAGKITGFPAFPGHPECNSELKRPVFNKIKNEAAGAVQYIGIAADEPIRIARHEKKEGIEMPLVMAGWSEQMCREWCEENGLLSPIYTTSARGGCWFCHNQSVDQLRQLRKNYPDLWALLLK